MKIIREIFLKLLKIIFLIFLVSTISTVLLAETNNQMSISYFIDNILRSFQSVLPNGEKTLNIMKMLIVLSIYIFVEIEIINISAEFTRGMNEIVRYFSKNRFDYFIKTIKIFQKYIFQNLFYWAIVFISIILLFKQVKIESVNDIIKIMEFLILNHWILIFILVISKSSLSTIILYIAKCFFMMFFLKNEVWLMILITLIIIFNFIFNGNEGKESWKL